VKAHSKSIHATAQGGAVGPPPRSILDVSCGIGTQALGLAALRHAVTASDLSTMAVECADIPNRGRPSGQGRSRVDILFGNYQGGRWSMEKGAMGYFEEARKRASRRRSAWNLLLIPAVLGTWAAMWYASVQAVGQLLRYTRPGLHFVLLPDSGAGTLIGLGLLFAWLPLAMVVSNVLVATVAPARRTLDREAQAVPGTDLVSANTRLLKVMLVITPTGLFLAILGILAV